MFNEHCDILKKRANDNFQSSVVVVFLRTWSIQHVAVTLEYTELIEGMLVPDKLIKVLRNKCSEIKLINRILELPSDG